MAQDVYTVIGKRLPRLESEEKVSGTARYLPDLQTPGRCTGKFSESLSARESSQGRHLSGREVTRVRAAVTGNDTKGIRLCTFSRFDNNPL